MYIKDFNRFICNNTKCKTKKYFSKYCLQFFGSERVLIEHKQNCLIINGKQTVKLKSGSIEFKNHLKQLAVSFKIYADFETLLKGVRSNDKSNASYTENIKITFLAILQVVCIDNRFNKKVVLYRGQNAVYKFIEAIIELHYYCKKIIKKYFNKNCVMSAEYEV